MTQNLDHNILVQAMEHSNLPHSISMLDGDMELAYVNQAFLDVTGYEREEVIGYNCRFLQGPGTNQETIQHIRAALKKREPIDVEILNYTKDGTAFWNQLRMAPIYDDNHEPIAYLGIQSNVTNMREGQRMQEEHQKLEALGRLTGNVSHEIKNALQPVKLMTEMLADWKSLDEESMARCIEILRDNVSIADNITQDVLRFSRRSSSDIEATEILELQENVLRFLKNMLHGSVVFEQHIEEAADAAKRTVSIRPNHLYQILINLMSNALHAMDNKGTLTLHWTYRDVAAHEAEELGTPEGAYLCIGIEDTGQGMDPKTLASAFDPFFSTKPPGDGTGLGLSISYRYVKEWGGTMHVDSAPGEGSCFTIYLPIDG